MNTRGELRRAVAAAQDDSYWESRVRAEAGFVEQLIAEQPGVDASSKRADALAGDAATELRRRIASDGAVTRDAVLAFEGALSELGPRCKAFELACVGHAHIDMNWMWGFQETVMVTIDTLRTVLALLERYPEFHFSQSQAAVYRIVERFAPQLVEPIRRRIAEGRWEVTATQWVESDMNMPSGESLARQMLYARRYLIDRYGAPESAFELVFLPDTFGHGVHTPELLAAAGVRYLYHCRGAVGPHVSRWEAPSGRSILVYREPRWYNTDVEWDVADFMPRYARETGLSTALCVYGVGDHGGGPTVRDIERLAEMGSWPLYPTVRFATLREHFERIARANASIPVVRGERNMIFTGCYSSQSRIKMANRRSEKLLYEAELDAALARLHRGARAEDPLVALNLREAWTRTLFSHFHDILPGSGVQLTREYALGSFQETAAAALSAQSEALRRLSGVDAEAAAEARRGAPKAGAPARDREPPATSRSEGAGVGFGAERFALPSTERGSGARRIYHVYNALQWERDGVAELVVWDWQGSPESLECVDETGRAAAHQIIESGTDPYWGHTFLKIKTRVQVPAFGRATLVIREREEPPARSVFFPWGTETWLVERPMELVLENERLRAAFDPVGMSLVSLVDAVSGRELLAPAGAASRTEHAAGGGRFRIVDEEAERMTAWVVGRYQAVRSLDHVVRISEVRIDPQLPEQWISYEISDSASDDRPATRLRVRVSLARASRGIRYDVECDWLESGVARARVPQLQYHLALGYAARSVRCDVPFGTIERAPGALDVPANSFAAALGASEPDPVVQITTESHYAFRFHDDALSLTLLRSSVDPDPYPELGRHQFAFTVSALDPEAQRDALASIREALEIRHPLRAASVGAASPGAAAPAGAAASSGAAAPAHAAASSGAAVPAEAAASSGARFLSIEAKGCIVAAVKLPEPRAWASDAPNAAEAAASGPERFIARLYDVSGVAGEATVALPDGRRIVSAKPLDLHERPADDGTTAVVDGVARLSVPPHRVVTVELTIEP